MTLMFKKTAKKNKPKKAAKKKVVKKKVIARKKVVAKVLQVRKQAEKKFLTKPPGKKVGFRLLRGMKDVLPEEQKYWDFVKSKVEKLAPIYGFSKIETPVLEETALFKRAVGEDTDIVEKEMFSFIDQGGENVCLRPEFTASVARVYIEHGMVNRLQPVKLWHLGPTFRYGRPQTGRLREFNQFGFEAIGSDDSVLDAQMIILFYKICEELKLEVSVQINSIGCPECRPDYRRALIDYLKVKKNFLCEDCRNRLIRNPLRVLDCKNEECKRLTEGAPQIVDFLCEECKSHFIKVLECLDECGIPYNLNSKLVRGLDYYTKTVFEVWPNLTSEIACLPARQGSQKSDDGEEKINGDLGDATEKDETKEGNQVEEEKQPDSSNLALGGGGRYDGLVEMLGGREATPAVGFAAGIERIILVLKKQGVNIPEVKVPRIFLAQLGDQAKKVSLKLFEDLRKGGIRVVENLSKDGLKAQLEQADKLGVRYTLIIGQKEILDQTVIIRDMESGVQEVVDFDKAVAEVKKRLK